MPATTLKGGTFFVTTEPAATTDPFPMVTPAKMLLLEAIQQSSSIVTNETVTPCSFMGIRVSEKL